MTEGRPLHGDGMENLQDYVQERLTYASDSDEYAEANQRLQQQLADLEALQQERGRPEARPDIDALINEAQLNVDRLRGNAAGIETGSGSQVDFDKLPPDAAARDSLTDRLNNNTGR